ncbi:MAG: response regulator [Thermoguttaceae bacterium]
MSQILIVEDDRPFGEALAMTLRRAGHEVAVAVDADEGVQLGLLWRPDVVIADWMLKSSLHGGEVCRRIRAACPTARTIIMTGYLDIVPEVGRWSEYGETIIQKPFHKEDILEAVHKLLACVPAET